MTPEEILQSLQNIEDNVNICCAVTMDPDDVLVEIDKLKSHFNTLINKCQKKT